MIIEPIPLQPIRNTLPENISDCKNAACTRRHTQRCHEQGDLPQMCNVLPSFCAPIPMPVQRAKARPAHYVCSYHQNVTIPSSPEGAVLDRKQGQQLYHVRSVALGHATCSYCRARRRHTASNRSNGAGPGADQHPQAAPASPFKHPSWPFCEQPAAGPLFSSPKPRPRRPCGRSTPGARRDRTPSRP